MSVHNTFDTKKCISKEILGEDKSEISKKTRDLGGVWIPWTKL
jgi:hypothetical protein